MLYAGVGVEAVEVVGLEAKIEEVVGTAVIDGTAGVFV